MTDDGDENNTNTNRVHIKLVAPLPLPFDTTDGIWVDPQTTTVAQIKQLIAAGFQTDPPSNDRQRIIYRGRLLQDDDIIASAVGNVVQGETIILHIVVPPYSVQEPAATAASQATTSSPSLARPIVDMPYLQVDSLDSMLRALAPFNRLPNDLVGLDPSNAILAKTCKDQQALILNVDGIHQLRSRLQQQDIPIRDITSIYDAQEIRDASSFISRQTHQPPATPPPPPPTTTTANINNNNIQPNQRFRIFINGREHHSPIINRMGNAYHMLGQYINMVFLTFHLAFILMFITDDYRIWSIAIFGIILAAYLRTLEINFSSLLRSWLPEMGFLNGAPGDLNPTSFNSISPNDDHQHQQQQQQEQQQVDSSWRHRINHLKIATKRIFVMFLASLIPEFYDRWSRDYNERVQRLQQQERERLQQLQQQQLENEQ